MSSGRSLLPFPLVYHDGYDLQLGDHVFPSAKYRMVCDRLLQTATAGPGDFRSPAPITDEEVYLVHDRGWIERLKAGLLTPAELKQLEIPFSKPIADAFWLVTGGTLLAGRLALTHGFCCNLAGGFHHAFPRHGEGFCAIHDVAVAIRVLQKEKLISKVLVVDCDVHHGNGTAAIFAEDESVFTYSIHQFNNYPAIKPPSDCDVDLPDGVADNEYLETLERTLLPVIDRARPDLICYIAGADPYREDQLGGLTLSFEGLRRRDRLVLEVGRELHIPVMATLAGGYAFRVDDTVTIHCGLISEARSVYGDRLA